MDNRGLTANNTHHDDMRDPSEQQLLADTPPTASSPEYPSSTSSDTKSDVVPNPLTEGVAPDGGWGWVVVFAVFMSSFLVDGCIGSFGIIYPELLRTFDAGPSVTSLAGSIIVAMFLMSCPLGGFLLRRFGCRLVCFAGGCITAAGFAVSALATDIQTFIVTYGVMGGVGLGMNSLAGNVLVNMYFDRRRGLACGIVSSGAGFGVFVLALATQKLLDHYGWRGTMLISAGIMLHFCVFACFLRPLLPKSSTQFSKSNSSSSDDCNYSQVEMEESKVKDVKRDSIMDGNVIYKCNGHSMNNGLNPDRQTTVEDSCDAQNSDTRQKDNSIVKQIKLNLKDRETDRKFKIISHDFKTAMPKPTAYQSLMNISHGINGPNAPLVSLPDLAGAKPSVVNGRYRNFDRTHVFSRRRHGYDPFLRKDVFYSGSVCHLKEYKDSENMQTFIKSMTVIPSGDEASTESTCSMHVSEPSTCRISRLCDVSVFQNGVYIPILIGAILLQMGQFIPSTFIPEYCIKIGLTANDGSVIISIYGAVNILGRLSAGCLANTRCINSLWLCNFGAVMCAVCCALFPLCSTFSTLCIFAVAFGYFIGYSCPLQYIIIVEYLGLNKLTAAMGILQLCKGPAAFAGPPLAGFVYEWTQDYTMTVAFAGALFVLASVVQSLVPFTNRCCTPAKVNHMEIRVDL